MKCKKCRKEIPDGSRFCNHCGTPTEKKKLYRRPDGLYEKILTIDGRRVAFRARKESEVYKKICEYEQKQEQGPLFTEVAEMWYDEHWETLSPTTQNGYKFAYGEITEYFAGKYLRQITHKNINAYIKQLPKSYARKTCATRLTILNMIFKYAVTEDICEANPCEYISIPKGHSSKKRRAPTSDEIEIIKKSIGIEYKGFSVGLLAVFLLYTGCRKGEALALQFRDIDINAARIHINKSIHYVHNEGQIKSTKTEASIRDIIIPQFLVPLLPKKGKAAQFVFSETPDKPMRGHFFQKAWGKWRKETGLTLSAHQLRHGYASLLLEADIKAKDAQDLLGHSDISTTQNIYTEVSRNRKEQTEKKLNQFLQ